MLGTYEYPDFPMDTEMFGVKPGEHIPGHVIHDYLRRYAERFDVFDKIRFNTKVLAAKRQESGGWILTLSPSAKLVAMKLVVATGLTSEAFLPKFDGQETFGAPIFHSRDFPEHADTLESAKSVTVFGGTKSAWDLVYAYGSRGVRVDWVIRGRPSHLVGSAMLSSRG